LGDRENTDATTPEAAPSPPEVERALRDLVEETQRDLRDWADRLSRINARKAALRGYLCELRSFRTEALRAARGQGIDLCSGAPEGRAALERIFDTHARPRPAPEGDAGLIAYELCLPERVPPAGVDGFAELDDAILDIERRLDGIGEDHGLTLICLQDAMNKHSSAVTTLSSVLKHVHDTKMSVIANMK
jgi:hypothetical protein